MKTRSLVLVAALVLTALLRVADPWPVNKTAVVDQPRSRGSEVAPRISQTDAIVHSTGSGAWPVRKIEADDIPDIFSPPRVAEPPTPPAPVAPPVATATASPPPVIAPFPFTVLGDWTDADGTRAVLFGPAGVVVAKPGDLLAGGARVVEIQPGSMRISYPAEHRTQQLTWATQ